MSDEPEDKPVEQRASGYAKGLRHEIMQAYKELGGAAFLKQLGQDDPKLFIALLTKMLPQAVEVSGEDGAPIAIVFPPL
jgi:hypothetical protein